MVDILKKYLSDDGSVKVHALRLHEAWKHAQTYHDYPVAIRRILGELTAAATLLASNLKFDGSLVLQLQGEGPVTLIVVECRADLSMRATVKMRQDYVVPDDATLSTLVNTNGSGRFIVVLDPNRKTPGQQAYQGIVAIESDSVSKVLEHYMASSEQLETRLMLAANGEFAAGLLLQRVPESGGIKRTGVSDRDRQQTWDHFNVLIDTVRDEELVSTDTDTLIHRLFWDEQLLAMDPRPVRWHCGCSRERIAEMLRMLGSQEVDSILQERGDVEVFCEFCGKPYHFDAVDCAELFTAEHIVHSGSPDTRH